MTRAIKQEEKPEEKKKTITAFLLMFPSMIIGLLAIIASEQPIWFNFLIIMLEVYQFVMFSEFIKDFYRNKY